MQKRIPEGFSLRGTTQEAVLYKSSQNTLVKAQHEKYGDCILKMNTREIVRQSDIKLLEKEYKIQFLLANKLSKEQILQIYEKIEHNGYHILVTEDFGAESLSAYMGDDALSTKEFLNLGTKISQRLAQIHSCRVIHFDLKPSNILYSKEHDTVKLIDFATAAITTVQKPYIPDSKVEGGTHAFMSPEQTGRLSGTVDKRSDIYSLGLTFYVLLTGQLPYLSNDPDEVIACHLSQQPKPINEVRSKAQFEPVPDAVVSVIEKMIQKEPSSRYQNMQTVFEDLKKISDAFETTGEYPKDFVVGESDVNDEFSIASNKLYGRDEEIAKLSGIIEESIKGKKQLCTVLGYSGIGKSALVENVASTFKNRVVLTGGKYDQINKSIPYSAFAQVLKKLVHQIMGLNTAQLNEIKLKMSEELGSHGHLLLDLAPELEPLLPTSTADVKTELTGQDLQNAFQDAICGFFRVISYVYGEVIADNVNCFVLVFLDDLQWADYNSLLLIEKLVSSENVKTLIIGAYRDNEVDDDHPLTESLATMEKQKVSVQSLKLTELKENHLNQLVADTTHRTTDDAMSLTKEVFSKTQGNPFFSREFLSNLYYKGILSFEYTKRYWEWDLDEIKKSSFSDNVVDFMLGSIQEKSTDTTKRVLSLAACIGAEFTLSNLALLYEKTENETVQALTQAIQEGWIFELEQNTFKFAHDRVQEATYRLLSKEEQTVSHHALGFHIYEKLKGEENGKALEEHIFEIVNHLNKAFDIIIKNPEERTTILELNLHAAKRAQSSCANSLAIQYCEKNLELFNENSWKDEYDVRFHVTSVYARSLANNKNGKKAVEVANEALEHVSHNTLHQLKIQSLLISLYVEQTRYSDGYALLCKVLGQMAPKFGDFELEDPEKMMQYTTENYKAARKLFESMDHDDCKLLKNEEMEELFAALASGTACFFLVSDARFEMFLQSACFSVKLMLQHGICKGSAICFGAYSICNYILSKDIEFSARIVETVKQWSLKHWPSDWMTCEAYYHLPLWAGAMNKIIPEATNEFHTCYRTGLSSGNNVWASFAGAIGTMQMIFSGDNANETLEFASRNFSFSAKCNNVLTMLLTEDFKNVILMMKGERDTFTDKEEYVIKPSMGIDPHSVKYFRSTSPLLQAWVYMHIDRHVEAYPLIKTSAEYIMDCVPFLQLFILPFIQAFNTCQILLNNQQDELDKTRDELLEEIDASITQLREYCKTMPRYLTCALYMVEGDRERLKGDQHDSILVIKKYQDAVNRAKSDHVVTVQALAYLQLGEYMQQKGFFVESYASSISTAIDLYKVLGYTFLVSNLSETHADVLSSISYTTNPGETTRARRSEMKTATTTSNGAEAKKSSNGQILRAASSFHNDSDSKELNLKILFTNMLSVILSNIGATRAVFILKDKGDLKVEACVTSSDSPPQVIEETMTNDHVSISVVNRTIRTRQETLVQNIADDQIYSTDAFFQSHPHIKCAMATPILFRNKIRGAIYLENSQVSNIFTMERSALLSTIISVSIHNAQFFTQLTNSYARFLPREFLKLLGRKNVLDVTQGDNVTHHCSVSFLDIRNFTGITEQMTAQGSMTFVNQFLGYLCPQVEMNDGFVDKILGDCIMSLFPNSVYSALKGIVGMMDALHKLNADHYVNKDPLKVGIGLHFGRIQLGTVGYANRLDATCIGDTVNTASRLESLTKGFGVNVLVSQDFYNQLLKEQTDISKLKVDFCKVGSFILKGRTVPLALYEVYSKQWKEAPSPRDKLEQIQNLFVAQQFDQCEKLCKDLSEEFENNAILLFYAEACSMYKKYQLPSDWNGAIPLTKDGNPKPLSYPLIDEVNPEIAGLKSGEKDELQRYKALYGKLSKKKIANYIIKWNPKKKLYEKVNVEDISSTEKGQ